MAGEISRQDILNHLDFLATKGLMNKDTVTSRKAAVNTLLSILSDDEARDLRNLDIDVLLQRFHHLKGGDFKPTSLRVYKSRLTSVLDDYQRYKADPLSYKPQMRQQDRPTRAPNGEHRREGSKRHDAELPTETPEREDTSSIVFPIPIRKGVIVKVAGIPSDLTPEEATKIGAVILALSGSQE